VITENKVEYVTFFQQQYREVSLELERSSGIQPSDNRRWRITAKFTFATGEQQDEEVAIYKQILAGAFEKYYSVQLTWAEKVTKKRQQDFSDEREPKAAKTNE